MRPPPRTLTDPLPGECTPHHPGSIWVLWETNCLACLGMHPTFLVGSTGHVWGWGMSWIRLSKHHPSLLTGHAVQQPSPRGQGPRPHVQLAPSSCSFFITHSLPTRQRQLHIFLFFPPHTNYCKSWESKYSPQSVFQMLARQPASTFS